MLPRLPPSALITAGQAAHRSASEDARGASAGAASRSSRTRSLSARGGGGRGAREVVGLIDEELEQLREKLESQTERCQEIAASLETARVKEKREKEALSETRHFQEARARRIACRMQAHIRGWLVRKRLVTAMQKERVHQLGIAAQLPEQLREKLMDLQHNVHDLKYQPEHRLDAIVRIQAFWRGVMACRIVTVLRVNRKIVELYARMEAASTKIASWFRGNSARLRFRFRIELGLQTTRARQMKEMEQALRLIIRLQRCVRARQARERVAQLFEERERSGYISQILALQDTGAEAPVMIDTWRPGGLAGDPAGDEVAALADQVREPPVSDREIQRLEDEGLEPFYWSAAQELVRHRIGGTQAIKMQRYLGIGSDLDWSPPADDELDNIGGLWDVYPEGLSPDFLDNVDADAWPWERPTKPKFRVLDTRPRKVQAPPPPSNAEERAHARREATQLALEAAEAAAAAAEAEAEAHPLFVNAPPVTAASPKKRRVPLKPAPPKVPPPRNNPRPRLVKCGGGTSAAVDEDASWGGARSFSHCPRDDDNDIPRSRGGYGRFNAAAAAQQHPLLAIGR